MSQNYTWPATTVTPGGGGATAGNQVLEIAQLSAINANTANGLTDTQLRASPVPVSVPGTIPVTGPLTDAQLRATPVPVSGTVATGGLTDAELRASPVPVSGTVTATGPLTDTQLRASAVPVSLTSTTITGSVAVTGPLTDTQLRATPVPVSGTIAVSGVATETTLAAFSAKTASGIVNAAFDYQALTYVGATTDIDTVVYKSGGAGGTTVATLTMGYDGSNRLTSVTRS